MSEIEAGRILFPETSVLTRFAVTLGNENVEPILAARSCVAAWILSCSAPGSCQTTSGIFA